MHYLYQYKRQLSGIVGVVVLGVLCGWWLNRIAMPVLDDTTYACHGQPQTALQIAKTYALDITTYQAVLTHYQLTPPVFCDLSPATVSKAVATMHDSVSSVPQSPPASIWQWVTGIFGEAKNTLLAEDDTATEHDEGDAVDPEYVRMRLSDENGHIPADGWQKAQAHIIEMKRVAATRNAGIAPNEWTEIGPGNIGGRMRAIVFHPTATNVMFAGGASGGIWKSTNAGTTWSPIDDFMRNLSISSIVFDPNNANTMYAGTGEYTADIRGDGVFVSTNAGTTWTQLTSTAYDDVTKNDTFRYVNKLLTVKKGTTTMLFAATWKGVLYSSDAGQHWNYADIIGQGSTKNIYFSDIEVDPKDPTKMVATNDYHAWWSTNSGLSWTFATGLESVALANQIAYAPSNSAIVYVASGNGCGDIYKSSDGGKKYVKVKNLGHFCASASNQWSYDNILWIDPTNANNLIAGGIDLWRSINGGTTFTKISDWGNWPISAHADQHAIIASPGFNGTTNNTVYFGNDGGIWRADNYKTVSTTSGWTELNNTLGTNQFYSVMGTRAGGYIVGGTQDNGSLARDISDVSNDTWFRVTGGDGGFVAIDPNYPMRWYGEYVRLKGLCRSDFLFQCKRIDGSYVVGDYLYWKDPPYRLVDAHDGHALFIAPFILDPNNSNTMLAGGRSLWRSTNVTDLLSNPSDISPHAPDAGPKWYAISSDEGSYISAITVAKGHSEIIWFATIKCNDTACTSTLKKSVNGTASPENVTWSTIGDTIPDRFITRIVIDANNANIVYVTLGGFSATQDYYTDPNIWKTTDGGVTWAPAAGSGVTGLPNLPIWSMTINPQHANWLYVGTEFGIFTSENSGATWKPTLDGPANVPVNDLQWLDDHTLLAGTYGRGVFISDLSSLLIEHITSTRLDATHIAFYVTFNKKAVGVDAADFVITKTGTANATISSVSGRDNQYTVVVTVGRGMGSIRLDTHPATAIYDLLGNALTDVFTRGSNCQSNDDVLQCNMVVTTDADSGAGSLRQALLDAPANTTITFDAALNDATIVLQSPLSLHRNVTIDGAATSQHITLSGNDVTPVFVITNTVDITLNALNITHGQSDWGGAIYNGSGKLAIRNSALAHNHADQGGAIFNYYGTVTIANSTLFDNTATIATTGVGTIYNYGRSALTLINTTIAQNHSDGPAVGNVGSMTLKNVVIGYSDHADCVTYTGGTYTTQTTLIEKGGCGATKTGNPQLASAAYNNGPTYNVALNRGSGAIDTGSASVCAVAPINKLDQRGVTRLIGISCDMGAYESGTPPSPTPTKTATLTRTATATKSVTATRTNTATRTLTKTSTLTRTATATKTATLTRTATATKTRTLTRTATITIPRAP